jgi:hypothetical protein
MEYAFALLLISVSASCDTIERLKSDYPQSTFVKLEGVELVHRFPGSTHITRLH